MKNLPRIALANLLDSLFDPRSYTEAHPEVVASGLEPLSHYLKHGDAEGLWPHHLFDPAYYGAQHPGLVASGGARLRHYLEHGGRDGSNPHRLFHSAWYLSRYPDVAESGENPLVHYVTKGEAEGRWPNPCFDPVYYMRQNPDLRSLGYPLLEHYARYGGHEGRKPHPLFFSAWYREAHAGVKLSGLEPLSHYLERGDAEGLRPNPLFDPTYYGAQHPELAPSGGERLRHYLDHGGRDGTDPHPLFQSARYLLQCPELAGTDENPLVHYLREGEARGLRPNPLFDPVYYRDENPDLAGSDTQLLLHFVRWGGREGRRPSPLFDSRGYLARHPELARPGGNPLAHYFAEGAASGENPHPLFDSAWYRETYPEVAASGLDPFSYYWTRGVAQGHDPHPLFDSAWYREVNLLDEAENPFVHYVERGAARGCQPNPLFDAEFYLKRYAVRLAPNESPLAHYVREGSRKGHRPSPLFDFCVQFFRQARPELRARGENPASGYFEGALARVTCPERETPIGLRVQERPVVSVIVPARGRLVYTLACLRSISLAESRVPFEVIVVDDASTGDGLDELSRIEGLRLIRNEENQGFLRSCNRATRVALGEELVFLNNDTLVTDLWLDLLLEARADFENAGIVGSRLVYPSGRLQEAGGIVFRDGSAANFGHGEDPEDPAHCFARPVDYVSAACLMIRRDLFEELGGFDTAYAPAFYEDTDLAFRAREAGFDVVYQPASTVIHFGGASHGRDPARGLKRHQERNRQTFLARWSSRLQEHAPSDSDRGAAALRLAGRRALVMDATMLTPDRDSGSLRMFNLIRVLRRLGFLVTFVPSDLAHSERYASELRRHGVHVVCPPHCTSIEDFLEQCGSEFELCILSRPQVAAKWLDPVKLLCPRAAVFYDTVDLHFLRRERELQVRGSSSLSSETKDDELRAARRAHGVIVVSEFDRERLLAEDPGLRAHVVSNIHELQPTRVPFEEREGILFIGGFRHEPNVDAVLWFAGEVLPRVHEALPSVRLHVVGSDTPDEIRALASERMVIEGWVPEPSEFFARCRVSVAPLRYGSGVKGKVNQSMSFGLPCVATSIAVEGVDAKPGVEILVADSAEEFAAAVIELYRSERLWRTLSESSLRNVERSFSMQVAEQKLAAMLGCHGLL